MALYRIADLTLDITPKYGYLADMCAPYLADGGTPELCISVSDAEIMAESAPDVPSHPGYLESLAVYRKIAERLADFDGFLCHGAVIAENGRGYMFCAPSGTGKTTHVRLWQKEFPDTVVINGDKPIIRRQGAQWIAYGTPWAGKEGLQTNLGVPLGGICMLERAKENTVHAIDPDDRLTALARHVYFPHDARAAKTVALLASATAAVPLFSLGCNISPQAAHLSHSTMTKESL